AAIRLLSPVLLPSHSLPRPYVQLPQLTALSLQVPLPAVYSLYQSSDPRRLRQPVIPD
ncbi:hypothetical protein GBAR_LOCUS9251, partial [Geodia barretti]